MVVFKGHQFVLCQHLAACCTLAERLKYLIEDVEISFDSLLVDQS